MSAWEIGLKVTAGRLRIVLPDERLLWEVLHEEAFERLAVAFDQVLSSVSLPPFHRDPFDRVLVVQACALGCPVLTEDSMIARYDMEVAW